MIRAVIFTAAVTLALGPCAQGAAQELTETEKCFEQLWKTFDEKYALFDAKGIDWRALYDVYRPQVTAETNDEELFGVLSDLLGHLNDNHVMLISEDPPRFFGAGLLYRLWRDKAGGTDPMKAFQQFMASRPVPEGYFVQKPKQIADGIFCYGWLAEGVGYFHFNRFSDAENSARAIDQIIDEFREARAVVIDVRRNQGGDDRIGKLIADRFADSKRLYMTTRDRSGQSHQDFAEPKLWYVEPDGPVQFTGTVFLLTDRTSISAAENFALAMKVLPHVVQVGDLTSGCFADSARAQLANGWAFSYAVNLFRDHTGFCWEGIGVPPEILVVNTEDDERRGTDRVVDVALALASADSLEPRKGNRLVP